MKMNPVVHFEMPAKDKKRVSNFYSQVFGWKMIQSGPEMGNYIVAQTTETDEKGVVKVAGNINGGFYEWVEKNTGRDRPSVVISVDDVSEAINKIKKAGGKITQEPTDIPGVGLWAGFEDTEGNLVSILQPSRM